MNLPQCLPSERVWANQNGMVGSDHHGKAGLFYNAHWFVHLGRNERIAKSEQIVVSHWNCLEYRSGDSPRKKELFTLGVSKEYAIYECVIWLLLIETFFFVSTTHVRKQ